MINHTPHYQSSNLTQIKKNTFLASFFPACKNGLSISNATNSHKTSHG